MAAVAVTLLAGCGGTTVQGAVPAPPSDSAVPHRPALSATPSPTPTEERVFSPGPPAVAYRTQEGAATLHVRRYSWQRTANGDQAAPPQHAYLVLDLQITATEGKVPVNPLYFVARGAGETFAPTMGADGNEPVLASADLAASQTAEGILAFDAPAERLTLQVNDELGRNVGEVVIPAPPEPLVTPPEPGAAPTGPAPTPTGPAAAPGGPPLALEDPTAAPAGPPDTAEAPATPVEPAPAAEGPGGLPEAPARGD